MTSHVQLLWEPNTGVICNPVTADGTPLGGADTSALLEAFKLGPGPGLLVFAARWPFAAMRREDAVWRDFARQFLLTALDAGEQPLTEVDAELWGDRIRSACGFSSISSEDLIRLWAQLGAASAMFQKNEACTLATWLGQSHQVWTTVGRLCFSLAENNASSELPFALLATFTGRLSAEGRPQHVPLAVALAEHKATPQRAMAARLAATLQDCAACSAFIAECVQSGRLFQPQALSSSDAYRLLRDVVSLETAGAMVRIPDWWNKRQPPRVRVEVTLGEDQPKGVGIQALVGFKARICLEGQELSAEEWRLLQEKAGGLVMLRGRWVEADGARLQEVLGFWQRAEELASGGINFAMAARLMAGTQFTRVQGQAETALSAPEAAAWSAVQAGSWLRDTMAAATATDASPTGIGQHIRADLRTYQTQGVAWLVRLYRLGFGACLADDMGLGKTLQVLAFLDWLRHGEGQQRPSLVVAPASLIGNWQAEALRFAPSLRVAVAHASAMSRYALHGGEVPDVDLIITTYGGVTRYPWLRERSWQVVVLDEAQAIKNPEAQVTGAVKALQARHKIALTGTPVENRPLDLWSIMDFLNPGLLGQSRQFAEFIRSSQSNEAGFGALRTLVRPFLLRRLKTDKTLLPDLPDKVEMEVSCFLTPLQVALYESVVIQLRPRVASGEA